MTALTFLFSLVLWPVVIGRWTLALARVRAHADHTAQIAWSWMIGALFLAGSVFVQATTFGLGTPLAFVSVCLWPALCLAVLHFVRRSLEVRRPRRAGDDVREIAGAFENPGWMSKGLAVLGYAAFLFSLWTVIAYAADADTAYILSGDELLIWQGKAKALWVAGGLNARFGEIVHADPMPFPVDHADYPLLNPLLQTLVFLGAGRVTHWESRLPMQIAMVMLVVATFAAIRRRTHPAVAGLFTTLIVSSQWTERLAGLAYSDHLVALGFLVAVDASMRARETGDRRYRAVIALGAAFSIWAKNEGMLLVLASLSAWVAAAILEGKVGRRRARADLDRGFIWALVPLGLMLLHGAVNRRYGLENDLIVGKDGKPFWRLFFDQWGTHARTVFEFLGAAFTAILPPWKLDLEAGDWFIRRSHHFSFVPPALLVSLIVFRPKLRGSAILRPLLAVLFALLGYAAIYIGTPRPLVWHLTTSMFRVLYTVYPATALLAATVLFARDGRATPVATRGP